MTQSGPPSAGHAPARLPELDGLRGIAIALVLLVHFGMRIAPDSGAANWVWAFCRSGWCGVDLFFVLSGFLITGILLDTRDDPGYYRIFYTRRVLRIFPLYYGVLFLTFACLPVVAPQWVGAELREDQAWLWLYLSNFLSVSEGAEPLRGTGLNFAHFWSLAIEEQFYLFWPLVVQRAGRKRLGRVCAWLVIGALPLRWLANVWLGPFAAYYLTPCRIDALAWGALGAIGIRTMPRDQLIRIGRLLAIGAGLPLAWLFVRRGGLVHFDPLISTVGFSLLGASFAGVVVLSACCTASVGGRLLRHGLLQELGRLSYGIYVFHGILQTALWQFADRIAAAAGNYFVALTVYVTLCGAASYALARVSWIYESAFLRLKRLVEYRASPAPVTPPRQPAPPSGSIHLPADETRSIAAADDLELELAATSTEPASLVSSGR